MFDEQPPNFWWGKFAEQLIPVKFLSHFFSEPKKTEKFNRFQIPQSVQHKQSMSLIVISVITGEFVQDDTFFITNKHFTEQATQLSIIGPREVFSMLFGTKGVLLRCEETLKQLASLQVYNMNFWPFAVHSFWL